MNTSITFSSSLLNLLLLPFLLLSPTSLSASKTHESPPQKLVQFSDINLLVITDAHSWISSHIHSDSPISLTATYGSIASTVQHVKALAKKEGRDIFFFNNGDHVEGSGLSDASVYTDGVHGFDLFPLVSMMPFDALNVGNHDLYPGPLPNSPTIKFMKNDVNSGPYNGAHNQTFIEHWNGTYLTSNTLNATTLETVGSQYTILEGENQGVKLLVFGFLYHMTDSCDAVLVQDPKDTVKLEWFLDALIDGIVNEEVDAIVVLSHFDLKDINANVILNAIRKSASVKGLERLEGIQVQFLTGHTHYRGFSVVDEHSSSFEAGHYLDTLGYIRFDLPSPTTKNSTYFNYEMIDANISVLQSFTGTSPSTFSTPIGDEITAAIQHTTEFLGLRDVLGCPDVTYRQSAKLGDSDSLYDLYMNTIIPLSVFNDIQKAAGIDHEPYMISSTGTLRYDVYKGFFYYDDVFAVAPFANTFKYYAGGVSGAEVDKILGIMNRGGFENDVVSDRRRNEHSINLKKSASSHLPSYIGGPFSVEKDETYNLFFSDYDEPYILHSLSKVLGISPSQASKQVKPWRNEADSEEFVDTTLVWAKAARDLWGCEGKESEGFSVMERKGRARMGRAVRAVRGIKGEGEVS